MTTPWHLNNDGVVLDRNGNLVDLHDFNVRAVAVDAVNAVARTETDTSVIWAAVKLELRRARSEYAPMTSAHEGYAILLEEVEELWDEVKKKPALRSSLKMRKEAIQVAAMAIRFIVDVTDAPVCTGEGPRR